MLYLIGGVSRAGKSTIATMLMEEKALSYIPLDVIMTTLIQADNPFDIDYKADSDMIAAKVWTFTLHFLRNLNRHGGDFLVEGILLWPALLADIRCEFGMKACFLGFQNLEVHVKSQQLREDKTQSWHDRNEFNDEELHRQIRNIKQISKRMEVACNESGFPYIESGDDIMGLYEEVSKVLFN